VNAANAANVKPSDGVFISWSSSPLRTKFDAPMNRSRPAICRSSETGFTLLEICFVLFIVAVLFAVSAPPVAKQFQEEQIRKPVRELQTFAKTARRLAMEQNRAYVVLLLNNGFLLEPLEKKDTDRESLRYELPNHVTFEIQRPSDRALERIADARWVFTPNGLCEPITFFFQRDQDWVRFRIDALTARIENEESFIR
jgi:type II secretory pathway pseudopilin PulG